MDDFENKRVSEFKVRFPNYCEGKSDDHILLSLKFIDAGNKLIRDKIDKDVGKNRPESLPIIITKLLRKIVKIMEFDIRPIAALIEGDTKFKEPSSYGEPSEDKRRSRKTVAA